MAETTAEVRRDIELTRERMSSTIAELERKLNVKQVVAGHPWPVLAVAFGAGVLLSRSKADVKAAAATVMATKGASSKLGTALDDVMATVMVAVNDSIQHHLDQWVGELKGAIGAPKTAGTAGHGVGPIDRPAEQTLGTTISRAD